MRLLVIGNGKLYDEGDTTFADRHMEKFLTGCKEHFDGVSYLCGVPANNAKRSHIGELDSHAVDIIPAVTQSTNFLTKSCSYIRNLRLLWKTIDKADFLYLHFPGNLSLISACFAFLLKKPYGVYLRGELGLNSYWTRRVLRGARFVIAHGSVLCENAARSCKDVELAVPMFDLALEDLHSPRPAKKKGPWNLLYVGRLEVRKGVLDLLEAMVLLRQRGITFTLHLVGHDSLTSHPKFVDSLGDQVRFVGRVDYPRKMKSYYSEADLFCFPSHDEGFPRVLYEAMAFGLPIVTTFVGSVPGIMQDGYNCLRVEVRDPTNLADTIEKALRDSDLRDRLALNGTATIEPILQKMERESSSEQVARKIREHADDRTSLFQVD